MVGGNAIQSFFFPLKFSALSPFTVKTALRHLTCVVLLVPPQDAKNKIISYFSLSRIECVCTYLSDAIEFFKFTSISSSMSAKLWKNRHLHMLRTNLESLTLSRFWELMRNTDHVLLLYDQFSIF